MLHGLRENDLSTSRGAGAQAVDEILNRCPIGSGTV
jgi:hypothetical protein